MLKKPVTNRPNMPQMKVDFLTGTWIDIFMEIKCKWVNRVLVNCYAPTKDKDDVIKNMCYDRLDAVYDLIPSSKVKFLVDFNEKIGHKLIYKPTIGNHSFHEESSDNGTRLINFDEMWNITQNTIKKVASEILGFQEKRTKNKWFDKSCKRVMAERDLARIEVLKKPTKNNKRILATKQRETKRTVRRKKREWEKIRIEIIENSYRNNTKLFFEKANKIKTGFKAKSTIMRSEDGLLITEKTEVASEFKNVFEKMFNQSTQNESGEKITTVEQYIEEPTEEEIEQEIYPLNTSYKILSNVLLNKVKPYAKDTKGKLIVDQIHTIKQIMEKSHEFDQDIYLLFVDFKQAYDSTKRSSLWRAMIVFGILAKLVRLVKVCVQNSKYKVKFKSVMLEDFPVETGLTRRCIIPHTLQHYLESIVKKVQEDSIGLKI
ncbi:hypothetical protein QTP88_029464 [Uroleucon formosanum]